MKNKRILSTRPVDASAIQMAAEKNIEVDVISFIETIPMKGIALENSIDRFSQQACNVIFTSMNAVEVVVSYLKAKVPAWNIFCMGNTTRQLLSAHFSASAIMGTGSDANELADEIINWKKNKQNNDPFVFFCGDKRRDELPGKLQQEGIELLEILTYKTIAVSPPLMHEYDGVLFFSPSAVHSFFSCNRVNDQAIFFAIGNTTGNTIGKYTNNKIVTSITPEKNELLLQAVNFFNS